MKWNVVSAVICALLSVRWIVFLFRPRKMKRAGGTRNFSGSTSQDAYFADSAKMPALHMRFSSSPILRWENTTVRIWSMKKKTSSSTDKENIRDTIFTAKQGWLSASNRKAAERRKTNRWMYEN